MVAATVPVCRQDLLLNPLGSDGEYVVKDPKTGSYFRLGPQEHFLLTRLDGKHDHLRIRSEFKGRFGEELSDEELLGFVNLARSRGLLEFRPKQQQIVSSSSSQPQIAAQPAAQAAAPPNEASKPPAAAKSPAETAAPAAAPTKPSFNLLYFRKALIDPDRILGWLAPKLAFCWTRAFLIVSALFIVSAFGVVFANHDVLASHFARTFTWQTIAIVAFTLLSITIVHEFGHGLTCKHHGGEVREMGILLMCFMPCLYCNVSDAWLIRDKSKRLSVTLAGGYIELCLWAVAVYVWRLTIEDGLLNYVALMVITISGFRTLMNFNPFLKLDGYYLLSDASEIHNLRQRALAYVTAHLRWLLWGAEQPQPEPRGKILLTYGITCWVVSIIFVSSMLIWFSTILDNVFGPLGIAAVAVLALFVLRGLFRGLLGGEFRQMLLVRRKRLTYTLAILGATILAFTFIHKEKRVTGTFEVRPFLRAEVRAPVAGFLKEVACDQGNSIADGFIIAKLDIPDLESRLAQKKAEIDEAEAKLRLLKIGPRQEEIAEQSERVQRAQQWRNLASLDLEKAKAAFQEELVRMNQKIEQYRAEVEQATSTLERAQELVRRRVISEQAYQEEQKRLKVAQSLFEQAHSEKAVKEQLGTVEAQQELDKREKELADEQGALVLLEAGSRPEEIEAEQARLARLQEEMEYLQSLERKRLIRSSTAGIVSTPHLREKIGQYFEEGGLICAVEHTAKLQTEITLSEQDVSHVQPGQRVEFKARALPFESFEAKVDRIAPRAEAGDLQSTVVVYCALEDPDQKLKPGMTGYGRIDCGQQPIGKILADHVLRYIRTEFWW